MDNIHNNAGPWGAMVTLATTTLTYLPHANQIVDFLSGLIACVAGIMTCVWMYYRIKDMKSNNRI